MRNIKVGVATINTTPLDWHGNLQSILNVLREASDAGVGILCLPEMCLTGYGCEDHFASTLTLDAVAEGLATVSDEMRHVGARMFFGVGVPVMYENALFNAVAVFHGAQLLGYVCKQHLAADGLHYEPRWFRPWEAGKRGTVQSFYSSHTPIGDLIFDVDDIRIGYEVCEDAWVADRPGASLSRKGVDVILNPSASHFAFEKHQTRKRFVIEGSRAFGVTYLYANLVGNEAGRAIYDGDTMVATGGKLVAMGQRFTYKRHMLTTAVVDIHATRFGQARTGSYRPSFDPQPVEISDRTLCPPKPEEMPTPPVKEDIWEQTRDPKMLEFMHAAPLALYDYVWKSGTSGVVISLSGGADSAACISLWRLAVRHGVAELGKEGFCARVRGLEGATDEVDIMRRSSACVYQSSENSSKRTLWAAESVANGLGSNFIHLDVSPVVRGYTDMVSKALGQELTWENADIALQNIQARSRSPSVWMIANLRNALLLATGNRSEASVGYCTMDGDTSGSLAPIGGVDKPFIRRFLRDLESWDHQFQCLGEVNSQQPTAELRPSDQAQTDEKDLMPYSVLDACEKAAIRDKMSPIDVYLILRANPDFTGHSDEDIGRWVERYFQLWVRNQWKRDRLAPAFHFDDENLDPKTWCRFPLLSGGFREELKALDIYRRGHADPVTNENTKSGG